MTFEIVKKVKEVLLILAFIGICYLINSEYDILGLFIDDLTSFTYFPNTNIFEYAFKFYDNATRYRPFYEFFQYIAFFLAGHNPHILYVINIVFNGLIAYYLFFKVEELLINKYLSFSVSILYLITHFACYQITQATGLMENIATLLSLMIMFRCIELIKECNLKNILIIDMLYLFISFTHERYMSIFVLIVLTLFITCINNINNRIKVNIKLSIIGFVILIFAACLIIIIRYIALGRFIPAGTSGSYVVDTFTLCGLLNNIRDELLYIIGLNVGNEAMSGVLYDNLDIKSKTIIVIHIISISILFIVYIVNRIIVVNKKRFNVILINKYFYIDILIIAFIILTVLFSSVTIYIEKRFILVPFILTYIYIFYIISQLCRCFAKDNKIAIATIFIMIISFGMVISRLYIENRYRKENNNTYFMIDQRRLNSLAKETVYKYGNKILDEKQIYILQNSYLYTDRYLKNFFTIYQEKYEKRPIEVLSDMKEEQIKNIDAEKSIFLIENRQNDKYIESTIDINELLSNN